MCDIMVEFEKAQRILLVSYVMMLTRSLHGEVKSCPFLFYLSKGAEEGNQKKLVLSIKAFVSMRIASMVQR